MPHSRTLAFPPRGDIRLATYRDRANRIAHDLNNALIVPLTLASLLAETLPEGQDRHDAEVIVAAAEEAQALVGLLQALFAERAADEREAA